MFSRRCLLVGSLTSFAEVLRSLRSLRMTQETRERAIGCAGGTTSFAEVLRSLRSLRMTQGGRSVMTRGGAEGRCPLPYPSPRERAIG